MLDGERGKGGSGDCTCVVSVEGVRSLFILVSYIFLTVCILWNAKMAYNEI